MTNRFDRFIAIDWSGARRNYKGIAVAYCGPGDVSPRLVLPETRRWTRSAIAHWLGDQVRSRRRLLIGLDFAFGMPFESPAGYLGGRAHGIDDVFGLWDLLDDASRNADDYGFGNIVTDSRFASLFWLPRPRPPSWKASQRLADCKCARTMGTQPECIFKMVGPKQVGKASFTGMRALRQVRRQNRGRVAVWPFESISDRDAVVVEIYPTLFRKLATRGVAKLRTLDALNAALRNLDSEPLGRSKSFSDHETDALISAAGLRKFIQDKICGLPKVVNEQIRHEGWIFGVTLPPAKAVPA